MAAVGAAGVVAAVYTSLGADSTPVLQLLSCVHVLLSST